MKDNMKDTIYTLIIGAVMFGSMIAITEYHNKKGGFCDQAKGTSAEYKIDYIMCK